MANYARDGSLGALARLRMATLHNGGRFLSIKLEGGVKRGMSGSPIIDVNGAAIGLISTSGGELSWNPSLMDCLPPWLLRKLDSA
jgi:hypothetical protein